MFLKLHGTADRCGALPSIRGARKAEKAGRVKNASERILSPRDLYRSYLRRRSTKVACSTGRNTVKQVPERPRRRVLHTRIEPPTRSTIPKLTHRPSPVPLSPLVVKKGSKIRTRSRSSIP